MQSAEAQAHALRFIRAHEDRLVRVELARLGRAFGAFHPAGQVFLDYYVETRPYHWALVGLGMYYGSPRWPSAAPSSCGAGACPSSRCGPSASTWPPPCS